MKTNLLLKRNALKSLLLLSAAFVTVCSEAQSGGSNFVFDNPTLQSGDSLQAGAEYLFLNVQANVDAVVRIDSLVNGASVNKIDDNSNGTGYKDAFQPVVQSGGVIGASYAVFTIRFYVHNTNTPYTVPVIFPTALDIDGSNSLKEFAEINVGMGGVMNYMPTTPDINVTQLSPGNFLGMNVSGVERNGIDTNSIANMFTGINTNVSYITIKYGTVTTNPSSAARQYSLYMNNFSYPGSVLPVKLASFTATLNNNNADLRWTTASEINVSHFTIERSFNGNEFSEAGLVFAKGELSSKTDYSFSDNLAGTSATVVYYRLRSADNDGKTEYSQTRMIRISRQKETGISILAFPNPVTSELRVTIPASWQNKMTVYEVYTISGQAAKRTQTTSSGQTETLNVSALAPGIYIVRVTCDGHTAQQRIVKQ